MLIVIFEHEEKRCWVGVGGFVSRHRHILSFVRSFVGVGLGITHSRRGHRQSKHFIGIASEDYLAPPELGERLPLLGWHHTIAVRAIDGLTRVVVRRAGVGVTSGVVH